MLIKILIVLAVVIVTFIVVVALRPAKFRVSRSATIPAPPTFVFAQVNDLHKFQDWSPWAKIDSQCHTTYEGPPAGTGAAFTWSGNNKVGAGRMTIAESRPQELVRMKLEFLRPFKATNTAEFTFKPDGNQTVVTWRMFGEDNFVSKAAGLIINFDKMVGSEFEKGLGNLKSVAELANKRSQS